MKMVIKKEPFLYYKFNTVSLESVKFCLGRFDPLLDVLRKDFDYEGKETCYFQLLRNHEDNVSMYYRASESINETDEKLCMALSKNGLEFSKFQNETIYNNIILTKNCHNFFICFDPKNKIYYGITGLMYTTKGILLYKSQDGIRFEYVKKIITEEIICRNWNHDNHFDSHNVIFWNEKQNKFYIYVRHNTTVSRQVQLFTTQNFDKIDGPFLLNVLNHDTNALFDFCIYTNGISLYPETDYYIGLSTTMISGTKKPMILVSENGVDFFYMDQIENGGRDNQFFVHGIFSTSNHMYLYIEHHVTTPNFVIKCYRFDMDRIGGLKNTDDQNIGIITTKKIYLFNKEVALNYASNDQGYVYLELYDNNSQFICSSQKMTGNSINENVIWPLNTKLQTPNYYFLKIHLLNSIVYAFYYKSINDISSELDIRSSEQLV